MIRYLPHFSRSFVLQSLLGAVFALQSVAGALKVGDAAPKSLPGIWVQGEAVKEFEGDKVYIVEFWATWCGPCISAIPHINEIYKKHKEEGLVVIGQNLGENRNTVSGFLNKMGSKMTYRVTVDDDSGTMAKKWLEAAGQNGIPCAFVISKKGKIAYIGHPMSMDESMLVKLLSEPSAKAPDSVAETKGDASAAPSAKATGLANLAASQIKSRDFDKAEASIAELNDNLTENFRHLGALLELDLLLARGQDDDAIQLAGLLTEDFAGKPAVLNAVAAHLVAKPDAGEVLRKAAFGIATPLASAEGSGQAAALAILARIAFQSGEKDRAIELQSKAASLAVGSESEAAKVTLEAYQQGRLP